MKYLKLFEHLSSIINKEALKEDFEDRIIHNQSFEEFMDSYTVNAFSGSGYGLDIHNMKFNYIEYFTHTTLDPILNQIIKEIIIEECEKEPSYYTKYKQLIERFDETIFPDHIRRGDKSGLLGFNKDEDI